MKKIFCFFAALLLLGGNHAQQQLVRYNPEKFLEVQGEVLACAVVGHCVVVGSSGGNEEPAPEDCNSESLSKQTSLTLAGASSNDPKQVYKDVLFSDEDILAIAQNDTNVINFFSATTSSIQILLNFRNENSLEAAMKAGACNPDSLKSACAGTNSQIEAEYNVPFEILQTLKLSGEAKITNDSDCQFSPDQFFLSWAIINAVTGYVVLSDEATTAPYEKELQKVLPPGQYKFWASIKRSGAGSETGADCNDTPNSVECLEATHFRVAIFFTEIALTF